MKALHVLCAGALVLIVLISGCTSSSTQAAATTAAPSTTPAPQAAVSTEQTTASAPVITGTTWVLGWFDDTKGVWSKVAEGSTITATFGTDGNVTGSSGCNKYSAQYRLGTDPAIWIRRPEIGATSCQTPLGVMSQESYYNTDLSLAEDYKIIDDQLVMFDKTGKKILQFDPS